MPDMLVKLYELPALEPLLAQQKAAGVDIRRALAGEKHLLVEWVQQNFSNNWASECEITFAQQPVTCFVAVEGKQIVGMACYDAAFKNAFGPTGVAETCRNRGIGKALLLACLQAMAGQGYGYAIIGWVGPADFYARAVGAVEIPDSEPGMYRGMLFE